MTVSTEPAIARTIALLRERVAHWRGAGETVGLVPTMGALHAGHAALVARARQDCARVVVSIFVNARQFGPREDFASYPRDEAGDLAVLARERVDLAYIPTADEVYPPGFATVVRVTGLDAGLCGAARPGHFDGVATVVAKLLIQARPDAAYFGEKDFQQLTIVRRLARDLDLGVRIEGVATERAADGLALSSRNAYLSAPERAAAPALFATLRTVAAAIAEHPADTEKALAAGRARLGAAGLAVEYLELVDADTLARWTPDRPGRLLAAVRLGRTRLIDNVPVAASAKAPPGPRARAAP